MAAWSPTEGGPMGWVDKLLGRDKRDGDRPAEQEQSGPVGEEQLLADARERIRSGFLDRDDLAGWVAGGHDLAEDDPRPLRAAAQAWDERLAEQAGWTGESDYDRLAAAFADLEASGVLARMNFTCCNTCGTTEIDDERTPDHDAPEGAYPFREWAYTFFHSQDAERLADAPADLFLTYSSFRPAADVDPDLMARARAGEQEAREQVVRHTDATVGRIVVDALAAHGLAPDWSGDPTRRIAVPITDWRKPLP